MINTPVRYQPETSLTRLPDVIDRLFHDSFVFPTRFEKFLDGRRTSNLLETNNAYFVQLVLPGVDPEKVEVKVVGQQLTIKAMIAIPVIENAAYLWHGLYGEEFSEVFMLPTEVESTQAEAHYEFGILTITLPKVEYAKAREIKVNLTK